MVKKEKKKENKDSKNELQEMKDLLQRKQAELENYRKQVDKRFLEFTELAKPVDVTDKSNSLGYFLVSFVILTFIFLFLSYK